MIRAWLLRWRSASRCGARERELAGRKSRVCLQPQDGDTGGLGGSDGRPPVAGHDDQCLGLEILEVKGEFILPVGGIERSGDGGLGDRYKGGRHLGPIGEHDRHPVSGAYAEVTESLCHG